MRIRMIIRYIKRALRTHKLSFMLYAVVKWYYKEYDELFEWFESTYQCVREYKADRKEVNTAFKLFKEFLDFFADKPLSDLWHWIEYH